ncbi:MAG TPA: ATP phosphoribosyltransferase regulatory subunit [Bacillota bacterium]|nr:ATP phosphoribosyltransferase regulatory subunit [Bacillota bacterium]HPA55218.1 ATP phosphoribosyltransferase regulatory subunit [Bacillota bacterium]HPX69946.1 ATP phosphoribosyltransferase regulatory subunit [Bacillota bacterium]HQA66354.1 ATP phosphoribosyltransferase regulatory subunit [Bacillota bacterium]HQO42146.1 ATP phosphoribosyltransferase regulatory subunit [Bacillota bacterium]
MQSFEVPQGMRDILTEESSRRTILQERLQHYMHSCGFGRVETPLFEYYELFSGGISPVDDESIVKTIDRNGRVVVLRPDMTIPTARVASTNLKGQRKPLKLFYAGSVYRADKKNRGAGREFCQVGAEIYGCSSKWLDIETLTMAKESFRVAGIEDYKIDIGHVGIIKGIFEEMSLTEEKKSQIISLISEKNLVELENEVSALPLDSSSKEIICRLPCLFGKPEDVFKGMDEIIVNETVKESVEYLLQIYGKCKDLGLGSNIIIDAGMTGNMKYYTGLIFKAYARGAGDVVISGGRYDGLLKEMGSDAAASGFAIYIDNMLEAVTEKFEEQKGSKILVIFSESRFVEALKYSEGRRNNDAAVNMVNRGDISDPEQYCRQYGCNEVVIFE